MDLENYEKAQEEDRLRITAEATKVRDRLNYYFNVKEWSFEVWYSNLSWHFDVNLGSISVHKSVLGGFFALVNSEKEKPHGGLAAWTESKRNYDRPEDAVIFAMNSAASYVNRLNETLHDNLIKLRLSSFDPFDLEGKSCKRCGGVLMPWCHKWAIVINCQTCGQEHTGKGELLYGKNV